MFVVKHICFRRIDSNFNYGPKGKTLSRKVSKNCRKGFPILPPYGWAPQIIHFNGVVHYKPSILGYPYIFGNTHILLRKDSKDVHQKVLTVGKKGLQDSTLFAWICQHEPRTPSTLWVTAATMGMWSMVLMWKMRPEHWGLCLWSIYLWLSIFYYYFLILFVEQIDTLAPLWMSRLKVKYSTLGHLQGPNISRQLSCLPDVWEIFVSPTCDQCTQDHLLRLCWYIKGHCWMWWIVVEVEQACFSSQVFFRTEGLWGVSNVQCLRETMCNTNMHHSSKEAVRNCQHTQHVNLNLLNFRRTTQWCAGDSTGLRIPILIS